MPKRNLSRRNNSSVSPLMQLTKYNHHLIPSSAGGIAAYALSGVLMLGVVVFAAVWVGNMIGHHLHNNK